VEYDPFIKIQLASRNQLQGLMSCKLVHVRTLPRFLTPFGRLRNDAPSCCSSESRARLCQSVCRSPGSESGGSGMFGTQRAKSSAVSGFGFRVSGFRFQVSGFGFRFSIFWFRVSGLESRFQHFILRRTCSRTTRILSLSTRGLLPLRVSGLEFGGSGLGSRVWG